MRFLFLVFLFFFQNVSSQNEYEIIGKSNDMMLEREFNIFSLIYKDAETNQFKSLNFTGEEKKILYKFLQKALIEKPQNGFMLQFEYNTLLILFNSTTVEILTYIKHNPDIIRKTPPMTEKDILNLFGKYDAIRI